MRIGLVPVPALSMQSLNHVFRTTAQVLKSKHDLVYFPSEYNYSSSEHQERIIHQWLEDIDIVLGQFSWPSLVPILRTRNRMSVKPPYVCFLLGSMPRGAREYVQTYEYFTSADTFIVNCTADLEMARNFFENAVIKLLPFPYDESVYYPLEDWERRTVRARMRLGPQDKMLLYSGRITVEKNLHTLLRVFSIVEQMIPNSHLIVAGDPDEISFPEFGVYPLGIKNMLLRTVKKLGLQRVQFVGGKSPRELRDLYNAADAVINMTLHHDENFGLSQVEAMACGTPVIATRWGGLKDTVVSRETGVSIDTVVTGCGVKIDWWEAANKVVEFLSDASESNRLRTSCRRVAAAKYSMTQYRQSLDEISAEAAQKRKIAGEPLKVTSFALEFWSLTTPLPGERPPYRSNARCYDLYRALIGPFAAKSQKSSASNSEPPAHQVLCLPVPLMMTGVRTIAINDPIFPFEVDAPDHLVTGVRSVLEIMTRNPVITFQKLRAACANLEEDCNGALKWMIDVGIILLSTVNGRIPALQSMSAQMAMPLFAIQSLNHGTDLIFVK